MNILMLNNTGNVGSNFKKCLTKKGHKVVLVSKPSKIHDVDYIDVNLSFKNIFSKLKIDFDIVHINAPNLLLYGKYFFQGKKTRKLPLLIHWHGTNLRYPYNFLLQPFITRICKRIGDYHLYSSIDLAFYLRKIPDDKKERFICPIDTNVFKPMVLSYERPRDRLIWGKGKLNEGEWIPHNEIPKLLNQYREVEIYPSYGLSPYLVSVSALEAGACGCKVIHHPYMTRRWILENASIEVQTEKLIKIYKKIIGDIRRR